MINSKTEKLIFVFIFIIMYLFVGKIATQIKFDNITINKGLTTEQYIESRYKDIGQRNLKYKYIVKGNHLFGVIDGLNSEGEGYFFQAFKGEKSGFMEVEDLPGSVFFFGYDVRTMFFKLPNGESALLSVSHFQSYYIVEIDSYKEDNMEFYINDKKMDALTFEDIRDSECIEVLPNLSQDLVIYCLYNGQKYPVVKLH